jgi:hypothetical protein
MADNRRRLAAGLAALVAFSLVVCPLGWGAAGGQPASAAGQDQIEFTPHVTPIPATPTPEALLLPWVWEPGTRFTCPRAFPEGCRPELATVHGDDSYGWGELAGRPDLALIWISDATGSHYIMVSVDDPLLQGSARQDDFVDLIEAREAALDAIAEANGESGATVVGGATILGLLFLCPETFGATCVGAGLAIVAGAVVNVIRNGNLRALADEDLDRAELNITGRFNQIAYDLGLQ